MLLDGKHRNRDREKKESYAYDGALQEKPKKHLVKEHFLLKESMRREAKQRQTRKRRETEHEI